MRTLNTYEQYMVTCKIGEETDTMMAVDEEAARSLLDSIRTGLPESHPPIPAHPEARLLKRTVTVTASEWEDLT